MTHREAGYFIHDWQKSFVITASYKNTPTI